MIGSRTASIRRHCAALLVVVALVASCSSSDDTVDDTSPTTAVALESTTSTTSPDTSVPESSAPRTGAQELVDDDFRLLRNRSIGLIANAASLVGDDHLADLIDAHPDVELVALFGPEHGLRGTADAGVAVEDSVDEATGASVFSLYGDTRKPTPAMLDGVEVLVYDLQDVGARYFTYISTMGLAMQAAAELEIPFVILDRPNPLGGTVAGFVRDPDVDSFIAQYPIADTYGLTAAELATAIVGEGWLPGVDTLDLQVVEMSGWDPDMRWTDTALDWVAPSPALQTVNATLLYPALVLFEATTVSVGRGTVLPFEVFGAPWLDGDALTEALRELELPGVEFEPIGFVPQGEEVLHAGRAINGVRAIVTDPDAIRPAELGVQILYATLQQPRAQRRLIDNPDLLDLLAGGPTLRTQLEEDMSADDILASRAGAAEEFAATVAPYRLYAPPP